MGAPAYARHVTVQHLDQDTPDLPSATLADDAVEEAVEVAVEAAATERPPSRPGLSPSRANDFLQCPQLFRFRVIDRLPEPPSSAAARGTLVHAVLEHLFDLPAPERTLAAAHALLPDQWATLLERSPAIGELFADPTELAEWLTSAEALLGTYFTLEDPTRIEPRERELLVSTELDEGGPQLRGIIDRVDVAPNGWVRVVDYKTGRSPRAGYESSALFQMRFYGLVLWRERGVLPRMLQLLYLGDGQVLRAQPTERELEATETKVRALWSAIQDAARTGEWRPRRSRLCGWCAHQAVCPEFGGTPPVVPAGALRERLGVDDAVEEPVRG